LAVIALCGGKNKKGRHGNGRDIPQAIIRSDIAAVNAVLSRLVTWDD
jgi:hypothetical protein